MLRIHDTVWSLDLGTNPLSNITGNVFYRPSSASPIFKDTIYISANNSGWHAGDIVNISNLNMIAGKYVTFRFNYKTSANTSDTKIFIDFTSSATSDTYIAVGIPSGTNDWKEYNQEIILPKDAKISNLRVVASPNSAQIWINSIRFTAILPYKNNTIDHTFNPSGFNLRGFYVTAKYRDTSGMYQRLRTKWNANVVRFGIEHDPFGDNPVITDFNSIPQYDAWIVQKISALDNSIIYARNNNIKLIIDVHTNVGGNNKTPYSNLLVEYNGVFYERYIYWWKYIANRYNGNDAIHAFDLMNEPADAWNARPHGPSEKTWWDCQVDAATEIRKIDPNRRLIFETNNYDSCYRFEGLAPFPFDNCYPSVHIYEPTEFAANAATTTYPGLIVNGEVVNKQWLKNMLLPLRNYQLANKYPSVLVGEFSTLRWKNGVAQWLEDLISIFDEWNWTWTYFNYGDPDQYGSQGWSAVDLELDNREDIDVIASTPTDRALVLSASMVKNTNPYL